MKWEKFEYSARKLHIIDIFRRHFVGFAAGWKRREILCLDGLDIPIWHLHSYRAGTCHLSLF